MINRHEISLTHSGLVWFFVHHWQHLMHLEQVRWSRKTTPLIKSLDFESGNVYWQISRENDQNFFAKGQSNGCEIQQGSLFHSAPYWNDFWTFIWDANFWFLTFPTLALRFFSIELDFMRLLTNFVKRWPLIPQFLDYGEVQFSSCNRTGWKIFKPRRRVKWWLATTSLA